DERSRPIVPRGPVQRAGAHVKRDDKHHHRGQHDGDPEPQEDLSMQPPPVVKAEHYCVLSFTRTYPTPRMVLIFFGERGSSPGFWRKWEMCTSTVRSPTFPAPRPASLRRASRPTTRPARRANPSRISNSIPVSSISRPSISTLWPGTSMEISFTTTTSA